jgi:hypothetical protein
VDIGNYSDTRKNACLLEAGATIDYGNRCLTRNGARLGRRPLQDFYFNLDSLAFALAAFGEPGGETLRKAFRS